MVWCESISRRFRSQAASKAATLDDAPGGALFAGISGIAEKASSFLEFCYSPELAVEATLQPIRRFGFDAAIIFSDILVIPDALGQSVRFAEGEGPRLEAIEDRSGFSRLASEIDIERLSPVYTALRQVRMALPQETALIGFCGAPWTLATYMIAGRGTSDQAPARLFAYRDRQGFSELIDRLVGACITHCNHQIEAGAQCIQIFDSWAGPLPEAEFIRWCQKPLAQIISGIRKRFPDVPIIGFPRGIAGGFDRFVSGTKVNALSLDTAARLSSARQELDDNVITQGNLDPLALIAGGAVLEDAVGDLLGATAGTRHIVNLGHGILPPTPIAHVEQLVELTRR